MDSRDFNNLTNMLKKMDEKQLSEGLKIINNILGENDKKKVIDMINSIKNEKK